MRNRGNKYALLKVNMTMNMNTTMSFEHKYVIGTIRIALLLEMRPGDAFVARCEKNSD